MSDISDVYQVFLSNGFISFFLIKCIYSVPPFIQIEKSRVFLKIDALGFKKVILY